MSNEILPTMEKEWACKAYYTDGTVDVERFFTKAEANYWANEECGWEGTDHVILTGPDYECFYPGDFS